MNLTQLGSSGVEESIALLALFLSSIAIIFTALTHKRESRVERSAAYLQLEVHSSQIFQYEAQHSDAMEPFRQQNKPKAGTIKNEAPRRKLTDQLYFQSLNLFEVAANFRKKHVIDHAVFASWVAWFYEIVNDWYFRDFWVEHRCNYTPDVRNIFDAGCLVFNSGLKEPQRKSAFYDAVAMTIEPGGCEEILGWLANCEDQSSIRTLVSTTLKKYEGQNG